MVAHKDVKPPVSSPPEKVTTPEVQVSSPLNSQLLRRAAHSSPALTPRDILTLQRTVGNRAVGVLLQRLTSKTRKAMEKAGVTVADVERWKTSATLTDADIDKVWALGSDRFQLALTLSATHFKGAASAKLSAVEEMLEQAKTRKASAAAGVALAAATAPKVHPPAVSDLMARGVRETDAYPFYEREGALPVRTWLTATADREIVTTTVLAANRWRTSIATIQVLLTTENPRGYDAVKLLELLQRYGHDAVRVALRGTSVELNMTYLRAWLEQQVTTASPVPYRQLVRLQAKLVAENVALTVYQADRVYAGSLNPPSRTGFLRYAFTDETIEIHTHWNENDKRIVSAHVQDNSENGTEIGKWPELFTRVMEAIRAAHNAATGAMVATTLPAGMPLT